MCPIPTPNTIEILPLVPVLPFALNCENATTLSLGPNPTLQQFASWGLARAGRALRDLLTPAPLSASFVTTTGLGGTTKKLSPFGVVDTLITVSAMSPTSISGVAGSSVPSGSLPSVLVATPTNHPVTSYPVTFSVPAGSEGSITGGAATTNGSGIATVGSWTLGSSLVTDLVTATVAPPHPRSGVQGSPVTFNASVTSPTVVSYLSGGYSYELIGNDAPPEDWRDRRRLELAGGRRRFRVQFRIRRMQHHRQHPHSVARRVYDLELQRAQQYFRICCSAKSVTIPNGWTGSLSIGVAIDNDVQVFVNGANITASAGARTADSRRMKAAPPPPGSFVFTASNEILHPGASNLIAVHARDRGANQLLRHGGQAGSVRLVDTDRGRAGAAGYRGVSRGAPAPAVGPDRWNGSGLPTRSCSAR